MIESLNHYLKMKDGFPWPGEVPEHWDVVPFRVIAKLKSITGMEDRELLSVYLDRGVIKFTEAEEKRTNVTSEDLSKYQAVDPGDFVLNNQQAWRGSVGVSKYAGIVSPAYLVLSLNKRIDPAYANFLFRGRTMVGQYLISSRGVGTIQRNLYWPSLKTVPILLPPLAEQAGIVRFLDHVRQRIGQYIRAKRKLINLLEEQKQAIIHRAVTRGLDPHVSLKPSGNEWLGDVPAHWSVRSAKSFFREVDERSLSGDEELLSVSHLTGVTPRSEKNITMFMAESYIGHKVCRPGDLVINTMWAWMAALGVSPRHGIVSPSYAVYRPYKDSPLLGNFADLLLRTKPYVNEFVCRSTGIRSSRLRLYPEQFLRIPILCPPAEEQNAIFKYVKGETAETEKAIGDAMSQISLLHEYQRRLITDTVTGELDVRDVAAQLPDEPEKPQSLDGNNVESSSDVESTDALDETLEPIEA